MNLPPAVKVTNLRKVYGSGPTEVVAMRDVTLSIAPGEIVGMFGPSGSGRSTLLTAMALVNPSTYGQISIVDKPVMDGPRALVDLRAFRRKNLGFVFQKANLMPFLTALENVQIALEVNDTAPRAIRKRAMELMDYLSIGPRAKNLPVALSGGEQQRVAVARALANDPSLILADEPTAALDSKLGRQVMGFFAKIAHERKADVIVGTHDHRTLNVFDRILDVKDGMIKIRSEPEAANP